MDGFSEYGLWNVGSRNILRSKGDAIVSPANSYGYMDGGIDLAYRNHFGLGVQTLLQRLIEQNWNGMLPVGEAAIIPTKNEAIPHLIAAPTMERPKDVSTTENAYVAMVAALRVVKRYHAAAADDRPAESRSCESRRSWLSGKTFGQLLWLVRSAPKFRRQS